MKKKSCEVNERKRILVTKKKKRKQAKEKLQKRPVVEELHSRLAKKNKTLYRGSDNRKMNNKGPHAK